MTQLKIRAWILSRKISKKGHSLILWAFPKGLSQFVYLGSDNSILSALLNDRFVNRYFGGVV